MTRKETTDFLGKLLIQTRLGNGYWAREVSIDYGTTDVRRVDFMQFEPEGVVGASGIEKGIFTCYEVKSCKADFGSGFGRNFIAEKKLFCNANDYIQRCHTGHPNWYRCFSADSGRYGEYKPGKICRI